MFSKYKYVHMLYREQNFTRAAEKLFISQPSLSAAIKGIEKEIGAPLFQRTGAGVIPTDVGQAYVEAVEQIVRIENECIRKINDIDNLETGSLTIGGTNYVSSYVFPRVVNAFTSRYPGIQVEIVESHSKDLEDMMKDDEIDLVVDSFDEATDQYECYPLIHERVLLCVPEERGINDRFRSYGVRPEALSRGTVDLEHIPALSVRAFQEEPFITLKKGNDMHARAVEIFRKAGISPRIKFSVDQMNIAYAMTEQGNGLCLATDTLFRYGRFRGHSLLYRLEEDDRARTLCVVYRKGKYCTRAMDRFIHVVRELID